MLRPVLTQESAGPALRALPGGQILKTVKPATGTSGTSRLGKDFGVARSGSLSSDSVSSEALLSEGKLCT